MSPPPSPAAPAEAECRVLARYLSARDPSDYVRRCYLRSLPGAGPAGPALVDRGLLGLARLHPLPARVADAYARWFRPYGPLRRRVILMLAILENSPDTAPALNAARTGPAAAVAAGVAASLLASAACLVAGIVLLGPLHLLSGVLGARR